MKFPVGTTVFIDVLELYFCLLALCAQAGCCGRNHYCSLASPCPHSPSRVRTPPSYVHRYFILREDLLEQYAKGETPVSLRSKPWFLRFIHLATAPVHDAIATPVGLTGPQCFGWYGRFCVRVLSLSHFFLRPAGLLIARSVLVALRQLKDDDGWCEDAQLVFGFTSRSRVWCQEFYLS